MLSIYVIPTSSLTSPTHGIMYAYVKLLAFLVNVNNPCSKSHYLWIMCAMVENEVVFNPKMIMCAYETSLEITDGSGNVS